MRGEQQGHFQKLRILKGGVLFFLLDFVFSPKIFSLYVAGNIQQIYRERASKLKEEGRPPSDATVMKNRIQVKTEFNDHEKYTHI